VLPAGADDYTLSSLRNKFGWRTFGAPLLMHWISENS